MKAIEQKYQTFWRRVGAGAVDAVIFYPLTLISQHVVYKTNSVILVVFWDNIQAWVCVGYSVILHGLYGQTIGKRICKVKVLDISERKLSFKQAFLRDIVPIIANILFGVWIFLSPETYFHYATGKITDFSMFPKWVEIMLMMSFIWFFLEIITMLSNKKRRAIHDFIAGSIVEGEIQRIKKGQKE